MPSALVVGAGVSGLTAARRLRILGWEVVVLESRDRIGGRTHTIDLAGHPLDLGASWVHGPIGNPLMPYLDEAGLTHRQDGSWGMGMALYENGTGWLSPPLAASVVAASHDFDYQEASAALGRPASLAEGVTWYLEDRGLSGATARAVEFRLNWLEGALNVGGPPDTVSLQGNAGYVLHPGGNLRLTGGYRTLVDSLATDLDIRTGHAVRRIDHTGTRITVSGEGFEQTADAVVVAIPLAVLKAGGIRFDPGFASDRLRAIDSLAVGTLEKVGLVFERRFWPEDVKRITFMSSSHRFPAWVDVTSDGSPPTWLAFYNPKATPGMEEVPAAERIGSAVEILSGMFPGAPDPVATVASDWLTDPASLGSYSYHLAGRDPEAMDVLARPLSPRLVLAGEHTVTPYFGTVHGALVSGERAAGQIGGQTVAVPVPPATSVGS
jgi:monoamine oxidase